MKENININELQNDLNQSKTFNSGGQGFTFNFSNTEEGNVRVYNNQKEGIKTVTDNIENVVAENGTEILENKTKVLENKNEVVEEKVEKGRGFLQRAKDVFGNFSNSTRKRLASLSAAAALFTSPLSKAESINIQEKPTQEQNPIVQVEEKTEENPIENAEKSVQEAEKKPTNESLSAAIESVTEASNQNSEKADEAVKKKEGFLKRFWRKVFGKKIDKAGEIMEKKAENKTENIFQNNTETVDNEEELNFYRRRIEHHEKMTEIYKSKIETLSALNEIK